MSATRTVYVCTDPGIAVFGTKGAALHVRAVVSELVRRGDRVDLVCARTGGEPPAAWAGRVTVHRLPRVRAADTAAREVAARDADAAVAGVLDRLHAPRSGHPVDLVYERYALWGRTATAWAADHGIASVLEVNAPLVEEQATHRGLVDRAGAESVAVAALSAAGTVVCVSDPVRAWAAGLAGDPSRVHTVPNGVETDRVRPTTRPVTPADAEAFTVGFVGTLKPWHGTEVLLDAVALLVRADPSYRLLLVGDGPEAGALADRARRLGVEDHVEATGAVAADDVPALLARMDVACAPYPPVADDAFYFSPLKVYEYLAAGLPVVASRVGDLPRLLRGGADVGTLGAVVEPGDPGALAAAVAALRDDTTRRAVLRDACRAEAETHDWRHVVDRILTLSRGARAVA